MGNRSLTVCFPYTKEIKLPLEQNPEVENDLLNIYCIKPCKLAFSVCFIFWSRESLNLPVLSEGRFWVLVEII